MLNDNGVDNNSIEKISRILNQFSHMMDEEEISRSEMAIALASFLSGVDKETFMMTYEHIEEIAVELQNEEN
jgi:hypothetical protein